MTAEKLAGLLARRFEASGAGGGPVSVEELHHRLVPYPLCREELGLATKAEYDLAMLRLLDDPDYVEVDDDELRDAVRRELDSPEPGLDPLADFSATLLRPGEGLPPAQGAEEADGGAVPEAEAAGAAEGTAAGAGGDGSGGTAGAPAAADAEQEALFGGGDCAGCGRALPERADLRYCPYCGSDQTVRRCPECSVELEEDWRFCPACGARAGG